MSIHMLSCERRASQPQRSAFPTYLTRTGLKFILFICYSQVDDYLVCRVYATAQYAYSTRDRENTHTDAQESRNAAGTQAKKTNNSRCTKLVPVCRKYPYSSKYKSKDENNTARQTLFVHRG